MPPRRSGAKGLVERANGYLETSFLPGRSFVSPADFNAQLEDWLPRANTRQHRALGCRPTDRFEADQAAMLPLPPVPPALGWAQSVRLPRDHYIRLDSNDYSVHPAAIGRLVEVRADLQTVTVTLAGKTVAEHARCWARHQTLTDPDHQQAAAALRAARHRSPTPVEDVERRALSDYDAAFGLTDEQVA